MISRVKYSVPSPRVSSDTSQSLQNTRRNPYSPSSTLVGPVNPSAARLAASTPPSAARPMWRRFTMAPLPAWANSNSPPAQEPATPSVFVILAASSPIRRPDRARRKPGRAGMGAAVGFGRAVKLEGVGHGPVGERRRSRLHGSALGAQNAAPASRAGAPRIGDDHLAPRQLGTVDDRP